MRPNPGRADLLTIKIVSLYRKVEWLKKRCCFWEGPTTTGAEHDALHRRDTRCTYVHGWEIEMTQARFWGA